MQAALQPSRQAHAGAPVHYERHRLEQTTLYCLVQQHAAIFIAQTEAATGADLPQFVKDEFDAFLECGILARGFLRLRCGDCGHDKLVAFSCKRRGFCPSCGAGRMAQTAAHLVDHVIPHVPVRQWVLSLPIPLRLLLASQSKLLTPVLQVVHRVITRHLLSQAGLKVDEADSGAVTLIQRFGSAANLNIHPLGDVAAGVHAASGGAGAKAAAASDPFGVRVTSLREVSGPPLREPRRTRSQRSWAKLLKRVFDIDMEHCPNCAGELKIIAAILEQPVIEKILTHLGLQARAPPRAPARGQALQAA